MSSPSPSSSNFSLTAVHCCADSAQHYLLVKLQLLCNNCNDVKWKTRTVDMYKHSQEILNLISIRGNEGKRVTQSFQPTTYIH